MAQPNGYTRLKERFDALEVENKRLNDLLAVQKDSQLEIVTGRKKDANMIKAGYMKRINQLKNYVQELWIVVGILVIALIFSRIY